LAFEGENLFITGHIDAIGSLNRAKAIALPKPEDHRPVPAQHTQAQISSISMPKNGSSIIWESDPNRQGATPIKGTIVALAKTAGRITSVEKGL